MSRLGIFVYKSNKKSSTSIAVGKIIAENSSRIEIETKDDPKQAVFSVIKKFQEDGIIISVIVINGTENYFRKTPFESNVIVLKRPELLQNNWLLSVLKFYLKMLTYTKYAPLFA